MRPCVRDMYVNKEGKKQGVVKFRVNSIQVLRSVQTEIISHLAQHQFFSQKRLPNKIFAEPAKDMPHKNANFKTLPLL
jgi:hypothetical protein